MGDIHFNNVSRFACRKVSILIVLLVVFSCFVLYHNQYANAQNTPPFVIYGYVLFPNGVPVVGARVVVDNTNTSKNETESWRTNTNNDGYYFIKTFKSESVKNYSVRDGDVLVAYVVPWRDAPLPPINVYFTFVDNDTIIHWQHDPGGFRGYGNGKVEEDHATLRIDIYPNTRPDMYRIHVSNDEHINYTKTYAYVSGDRTWWRHRNSAGNADIQFFYSFTATWLINGSKVRSVSDSNVYCTFFQEIEPPLSTVIIPPFTTAYVPNNASELCEEINLCGTHVVELFSWNSSTSAWESYFWDNISKRYAGKNFDIHPSLGYFVRCDTAVCYKCGGEFAGWNRTYSIKKGWNLIGILRLPNSCCMASELFNSINEQCGGGVKGLGLWSIEYWLLYVGEGNDFLLKNNSAYFLFSTENFTLNLNT